MATGSDTSAVELLDRDIDDLTAFAVTVDGQKRRDLLIAAAERLQSAITSTSGSQRDSDILVRFKLLGFVQALLAAMTAGALDGTLAEKVVRALSGPAAADDPADRLAALSAVGVLAVRVDRVSDQLEKMLVGIFERALSDPQPGIRELAREVMSPGGAVERRMKEAHLGVVGVDEAIHARDP